MKVAFRYAVVPLMVRPPSQQRFFGEPLPAVPCRCTAPMQVDDSCLKCGRLTRLPERLEVEV